MKKQIESSHYDFLKYMHLSRWSCYYIQIKTVLQLSPKTILEIGPGDGIFGWYMHKNGITYKSCDHADDINSDYKAELGSEVLPIENSSFDVVCAFQVLEHIPFNRVSAALDEIHRVSKKYVFLDIPEHSVHFQFFIKIPFLPLLAKHFTIPRPEKHEFDGFHHWEISKQGYSREKVRNLLSEKFIIREEFTILQNPKERFFLLEKK
jgi:hypothetical protein